MPANNSNTDCVFKVCRALDIDEDVDCLTLHMITTTRYPFRMPDIHEMCRDSGISVKLSLKKPDLVREFVNALFNNDKACRRLLSTLKSIKKAGEIDAINAQIAGLVSKVNKLKVKA
jgi:hypothetical protein